MKMAKTVQACHKAGFAGYKNAHAIGNTIVAKIDPRDTNLVKMTMPTKVVNDMPNARGTNARKAPAEVATPLPPLNFMKGENV